MAVVKIRGVSHDPPDRILQLQQLLHEGGVRVFNIAPSMLAEIIAERKWVGKRNSKGEAFSSFEDFARQPLWDGLDCNSDDLLAICRKRPDVQRLIKNEMSKLAEPGEIGGGHSRGDNVTSGRRGNSPTYALRRLKRDRPDLADKVVKGELSANAAAIEAGFRKKPTVYVQILELIPKLTDEERDMLVSDLMQFNINKAKADQQTRLKAHGQ